MRHKTAGTHVNRCRDIPATLSWVERPVLWYSDVRLLFQFRSIATSRGRSFPGGAAEPAKASAWRSASAPAAAEHASA